MPLQKLWKAATRPRAGAGTNAAHRPSKPSVKRRAVDDADTLDAAMALRADETGAPTVIGQLT
jgi:hypothetical protein